MRSKLLIAVIAVSALVPARAAPLRAQAVSQVPEPLLARDLNALNFGDVLPGIPSRVPARDAGRAGLFEIRGPAGASVRVEFLLPASLLPSGEHPGDAVLPVSFGAEDGFSSFRRGGDAGGLSFNPHMPVISTLGGDGHLFLRMGGTVFPRRPQPGGPYRAIIYMTVFNLGS